VRHRGADAVIRPPPSPAGSHEQILLVELAERLLRDLKLLDIVCLFNVDSFVLSCIDLISFEPGTLGEYVGGATEFHEPGQHDQLDEAVETFQVLNDTLAEATGTAERLCQGNAGADRCRPSRAHRRCLVFVF
jgi:hypothetical protein